MQRISYFFPMKPLAFLFCIVMYSIIVLPVFANAQERELPKGIFGYTETVGDTVIPFSWKVEEYSDSVIIKVFEKQKSFLNICSYDGSTLKWQIKEKGRHDIVAERIGNTLNITGIRFGKPYSKTVQIDDRPWYQPLSYSLAEFLDSDKDMTSFWVIRADSIEVLPLTARKIGEEKIYIGDLEIPSQKVEVRAEGFKSKFWHSTYWYRKSDNLFIRYRGVHGFPGTDETIVELVKSPEEKIGI